MKTKSSKKIFAVTVIVVTAVLGVVGWFVLPDQVVTQVGFSGEAATRSPKFFALIIPFLLSVGLSLPYVNTEEENKKIWLALLGPVLYIITFIVNI
ncbi:MAG: DUF1648 domain-containing protein [bacterium]|nr:DUF1648 domain-containing protein [bacterium]